MTWWAALTMSVHERSSEAVNLSRRSLVAFGATAPLLLKGEGPALAAGTGDGVEPVPALEFALEIIADLGDVEDMGVGPLGGRRIVPILGGTFQGPRIGGIVRPGGADRQLVRSDGVRHLSALYELEAKDGAIITVLNKVLVENFADGSRYAFSTPEISAPKGPHDWLNHAVFVGTLGSLRPSRQAVRVRFYRLI